MRFNVIPDIARVSGVYLITSTVTDDMYVGASGDLFARYRNHCSKLRNGKLTKPFKEYVSQYGALTLEFSIIEIIDDKKELSERERELILLLKPTLNTNAFPTRSKTKEGEKTKRRITLLLGRNAIRRKSYQFY